MAFTIPTTKELAAQFLAAIESQLNQTTPPVARAFNRVLSAVLGLFGSGVHKHVADRALQCLALTATREGLDLIGANYGVARKAAVATVLEVTLPATAGTLIPSGTVFTSDDTGETYTTLADVTADAFGVALLSVVAATVGESGNLSVGDALSIGTQIAGADSTGYVTDTVATDGLVVIGLDAETDATYRRRVLTRIRAAGGGGNAADYRTWGEAVDDVARVFPYSGKPVTFTATGNWDFDDGGGAGPYTITYAGEDPAFDFEALGFHQFGTVTVAGSAGNNGSFGIVTVTTDVLTVLGPLVNALADPATLINESLPGDRVVYVESASKPTACPSGTLDAVRAALLTDPETGLSRMPLGLVEERLYVESAIPVSLGVEITGLDVDPSIDAEVKAKILAAVTDYFARCSCFVGGLDYAGDRTDTISAATLGAVIQGVLRRYGAAIESVTMDAGDIYQLGEGELPYLSGVTYP
jgi:hypothetical protein